MNYWKVIYDGYDKTTKWSKIIFNVIANATPIEKTYLAFIFIMFFSFMWLYFNHMELAFYVFGLSEVLFILKFNELKKRLMLDEYGDPNMAQSPPDNFGRKGSRYMMFKRYLKDRHVDKSHVNDCFELIDMQIDIALSEGLLGKKFIGFLAGILLGFMGAIWKQLDDPYLFYSGFSIVIFGGLLFMLMSMIPSKLEKMKEMKYFMLLYCKEFK